MPQDLKRRKSTDVVIETYYYVLPIYNKQMIIRNLGNSVYNEHIFVKVWVFNGRQPIKHHLGHH